MYFRKRIGEKGIELILSESIRVNDDKSDDEHHGTAFIDSTVQEKNVTYPTDAKLHKKIVGKVLQIGKELKLPLRQSYTFVLKRIYRDQRFRNHSKNRKKALKADKHLRTIAGRLVRELKRNLGENQSYDEFYPFLKRYSYNVVNRPIRFILSMSRTSNVFLKVKNTRSTNLGTKYLSYVLPQVLFLVPVHFATNMTAIRSRRVWSRCFG